MSEGAFETILITLVRSRLSEPRGIVGGRGVKIGVPSVGELSTVPDPGAGDGKGAGDASAWTGFENEHDLLQIICENR